MRMEIYTLDMANTEVTQRVNHRQTPAYYDSMVRKFCLAGCETERAK